MLLPIRLICSVNKVRKDGTALIFIQYCHSAHNKTLLNTGIAIPPRYWQKRSGRISEDLPLAYGKAAAINKELQTQRRLAEDIIDYALQQGYPDPVAFVKNTFQPKFELSRLADAEKKLQEKHPSPNLSFFAQFDLYVASKEKKVTAGMLKTYNNVKGVLKEFEIFRGKEITFSEIDYNFYEELVDYLTLEHVHRRKKELVKGLKTSSAGKVIKQLRIFLTNRIRKKIIAPINLEDFKILDEASDAIYLTEKEIRAIHLVNLSQQPHLDKYRNLLVFGCLTGLRFSDFSTIKADDVRGRRLYKKQNKSNHWVVVPLREEAYHIFIRSFNKKIPTITNPDFNYYIKEVGRLAGITEPIRFSHKKGNRDIEVVKPKCDWITSHTCRRSFCTNEFLAGTPAELIMKISGHKSLRDFYRYIRITPEQAAQQMEIIWKQREIL